jgi:hypothetical protein
MHILISPRRADKTTVITWNVRGCVSTHGLVSAVFVFCYSNPQSQLARTGIPQNFVHNSRRMPIKMRLIKYEYIRPPTGNLYIHSLVVPSACTYCHSELVFPRKRHTRLGSQILIFFGPFFTFFPLCLYSLLYLGCLFQFLKHIHRR